MNDFETNSQHLTDFTRSTIEPFSPEIPSKLSSSQLKLRQLVKKTPATSSQTDGSTPVLNQFSKHSAEAALFKTLSPTVSHLPDYSQLLSTKQKNNPSPKLESAVSSKFPLKNVASPSQRAIDDLKGKSTFGKGKPKAVGPFSNLNLGESPKAGNIDAKTSDINGQSSAKHSGFNPQSHINYMFFQPKTSLYQNRKAVKINSYFQEEDSDEKNLSIGDKANSVMLPHGQMLKGGANSKNVSQDNQTINSSLIYDNKRILGKGFTNCKFFKSRANKSIDKGDKNGKVLKEKMPLQQQQQPSIRENIANKNSNESLALKKHTTQSPKQLEVETPNKPNTTAEKTLLITQYTITHENIKSHETEPIMLTEVHTPVMAPKLSKNYYMPGRKASMPVVKETKTHTRQRSSSKEARFKSASKPSSKHGSPHKDLYGSAKGQKKGLMEFERSNEMSSGIQDTTAHTKGTITKDLTFEENDKNTVKRKKLMRANSHGGGGQLEKAIEERIKNEKLGKIGTKTKEKKEKMKEKRGQGWFKSVDYDNVNMLKGDDARRSMDKKGVVIEENGKKGEDDRVAVLSQLLQRTNRVLNSYKEREKNWQVERQELMEKLDRLMDKENLA